MVSLATGGYATVSDLAAWLGESAPANAVSLLRAGSLLVAAACFRDPYIDAPTNETAMALRDATCAQAQLWITLGVDPGAGGLDARVAKSTKIGSGSVEFDALPAEDVAQALTELAAQARAILLAAGLIFEPAPVGAPECDWLRHFGIADRPLFDAFIVQRS